jgi:hypothetical protein
MFPVKFNYGGEIRRVQIVGPSGRQQQISFGDLRQAAINVFPQLVEGEITFLWRDDENDLISCSTNEELLEALRVMTSEKRETLKFDVAVQDQDERSNPKTKDPNTLSSDVRHPRVRCDGCGVRPIIGIRYKCCVRDNFDLCERCESATPQPHPMIKIYTPDQSPAAIFVAVNEDNKPHRHPHHPPYHPHHPPHHHARWAAKHGFQAAGPFPVEPPHGRFHGGRGGPGGGRKWERKGDRQCPWHDAYGQQFGLDPTQGSMVDLQEAIFESQLPDQPEAKPQQQARCDEEVTSEEQQLIDAVLRESMHVPDVPAAEVAVAGGGGVVSAVVAAVEVIPAPAPAAVVPAFLPPPPPAAAQVEDLEPAVTATAASAAAAVWSKVWARELEILQAMGFTETAALIPLLQEFVGAPSPSPDAEALEKMQRLVAHLLGSSA